MLHGLVLANIGATLPDPHTQFQLVVNSVLIGDGEGQRLWIVCYAGPWLQEEHGLLWDLRTTHLDHVFEIVLAHAYYFWSRGLKEIDVSFLHKGSEEIINKYIAHTDS